MYSHNFQNYIHNDGQDQEESTSPKCCTLGMTRIEGGRYDFKHSLTESSFYIPRSDKDMELFPKFCPKREGKLNLLFYNGMKDFVGVFPRTWQYPSASNLSAYNTYGLNWNSSNGLVKIPGKEYLTWLDNIKLDINWLIHFSGSDIRSLDWSKKIRIKNQEYLISYIKVDYSLEKMEVKEVGVVRC